MTTIQAIVELRAKRRDLQASNAPEAKVREVELAIATMEASLLQTIPPQSSLPPHLDSDALRVVLRNAPSFAGSVIVKGEVRILVKRVYPHLGVIGEVYVSKDGSLSRVKDADLSKLLVDFAGTSCILVTLRVGNKEYVVAVLRDS